MSQTSYLDYSLAREIGQHQWHASVSRIDSVPMMLNRSAFDRMEIGIAWPTSAAAVEDAKRFVDSLVRRLR